MKNFKNVIAVVGFISIHTLTTTAFAGPAVAINTLQILKNTPADSVVSADFDVDLVGGGTKDANCSTTLHSTHDDPYGLGNTMPFPQAGTAFVFTNISNEVMLINATLVSLHNDNSTLRSFAPQVEASVNYVSVVLLNKNVTKVIQLNPNESFTALIPPLENPTFLSTNVRFRCQLASAFAKRPAFSYGSIVDLVHSWE